MLNRAEEMIKLLRPRTGTEHLRHWNKLQAAHRLDAQRHGGSAAPAQPELETCSPGNLVDLRGCAAVVGRNGDREDFEMKQTALREGSHGLIAIPVHARHHVDFYLNANVTGQKSSLPDSAGPYRVFCIAPFRECSTICFT